VSAQVHQRTICLDLDGTLCTNTWGDYESALPFPWAVERVNALSLAGNRILIFTARGSTTGIDWRQTTESQLSAWGVRYDELILGKPQADIYVDDRTVHVDAWRYGDAVAVPPGDGIEIAPDAMPALPPPRSTTVVEVGRTFKGEPFRPEDHARRLAAAAGEQGIRSYSEPQICGAVHGAIERNRDLLQAGDDVIFTIALSGPPHAGYVDTVEHGLDARLTIGCRPVSQAAAALPRYFRDGGVAAGIETTASSVDVWPLHADASGALRDTFGGEAVAGVGRDLRVRPQSPWAGVGLAQTLEFATELGLGIEEHAPIRGELGGDEELLIVDLPFCVLPVGSLDGERLRVAPGPIALALAEAWRTLTGVDPTAYWGR
jgi:hypothetical protein